MSSPVVLDNLADALNKPHPGCSSNTNGTAYLFEICKENPSYFTVKVLNGRNARRFSPNECSRHFIDNTNLHSAFHCGVGPLVAVSVDDEKTWRSGVALCISPLRVVVQPVVFNDDLSISGSSFDLTAIVVEPIKFSKAH